MAANFACASKAFLLVVLCFVVACSEYCFPNILNFKYQRGNCLKKRNAHTLKRLNLLILQDARFLVCARTGVCVLARAIGSSPIGDLWNDVFF